MFGTVTNRFETYPCLTFDASISGRLITNDNKFAGYHDEFFYWNYSPSPSDY